MREDINHGNKRRKNQNGHRIPDASLSRWNVIAWGKRIPGSVNIERTSLPLVTARHSVWQSGLRMNRDCSVLGIGSGVQTDTDQVFYFSAETETETEPR